MVIRVDRIRKPLDETPTKVGGECVPSYLTFALLRRADQAKIDLKRTTLHTEIYPGDGTPEASRIEQRISNLLGLDRTNIIAYPSGMSALESVIESEGPTKGTVVLHAADEYARTKKYLERILGKRGVKTPFVDTTSMDELRKGIERHRPQIIVLETVGNGPNVPIIDLEAFFAIEALKEINPLIVLDNTLPTPTLIPAQKFLGRGLRVVGVESAMKAYSRNGEMLGVVYTDDLEKIAELLDERITRRQTPFGGQGQRLSNVVIGRKEDFDEKNLRTMWNSLQLAQACFEAQGDGSVFTVWHPNVGDHPNRAYADLHFPEGASPLFYIQATDPFKSNLRGKTHDEIAKALEDDPAVNALIEKGHSFGTRYTRVFPDPTASVIRISAGLEDADRVQELAWNLGRTLRAIS